MDEITQGLILISSFAVFGGIILYSLYAMDKKVREGRKEFEV